MRYKEKQRGVSIYLALTVVVILLAVALGLNTILLSQLKMLKGMEDSVLAFYAADSGIEQGLFIRSSGSGNLDNGASYQIQFFSPGDTLPDGSVCSARVYCLNSAGSYQETKRAIKITR